MSPGTQRDASTCRRSRHDADKRCITCAHPPCSSAHVLRRRLWRCGIGLAVFVATLAIGNAFVAPEKQLSLRSAGHDFLAFYTAGTFVRDGRAELYELSKVGAFQQTLAARQGIELGNSVAPWWNPPFYALVFAPLSQLSYRAAWLTWMGVNILCALIACALLGSMLPKDCTWKDKGLVPLLVITSLPFIQSIGHGQNTCTSLLLVATTVMLWRQRRALSAGLVLGLLFYKPQLAAVLALALIITLGRRTLIGLLITGIALLLTNVIVLPGTLGQFLERVPANLHLMQFERAYVWDRHVTLTAFWRLIVQGNSIGETHRSATLLAIATAAALAALLLRVLVRARRSQSYDAAIAATLITTPLLMPFYFDYDLLLLASAGVLFAGMRLSEEVIAMRTWQTASWIGLYVWLFVNPQFASWSDINVAVLIVANLAVATMISALRADTASGNASIRTNRNLATPAQPLLAA